VHNKKKEKRRLKRTTENKEIKFIVFLSEVWCKKKKKLWKIYNYKNIFSESETI